MAYIHYMPTNVQHSQKKQTTQRVQIAAGPAQQEDDTKRALTHL